MPKPLAMFDIDNTMSDGFVYLALIANQAHQKLIPQSTLDSINNSMQHYRVGQQSYEATALEVLTLHAAGLKGVSQEVILTAAVEFYQQSSKFFAYVRPTIQSLQLTHEVLLVTAQPQFCAQAVGKRFGVRAYCASEFEVTDGMFSGKIVRHLASRHDKHDAIKHLTQGRDMRGSFAFGDSEGDIEMLGVVEYPICLNPTDKLREVAGQKGWYMPDIQEVSALVARLSKPS